jgi:hypothetical protein
VNGAKNAKKRGRGRPFQAGNPGRKKGQLNKFTTLKQSFLNVYLQMGGDAALLEFSRTHKPMFYQMITKLFPQELETEQNVTYRVIYDKDAKDKPDAGS